MEYNEKRADHYKDQVERMTDSEKVTAWNQMCQDQNRSDDEIFSNDEEFFSTFFSDTMEAVRAVCFGEYRYQDDWVQFNGYGNLESSNDPAQFIDDDELIKAIEEDPSSYDVEEFEEEEDEEEEDEEREE